MIDTNVYLSRWPFRRLRGDHPTELAKILRQHGITQAWAGSFDALLHRDIEGVNHRLSDMCKKHGAGLLLPFGTVNPTLPDWQEDLRRCHKIHHMPGIRLHPNYHGYQLDDPNFAELLKQAAERNLLVQLSLTMEDERTQHPLLQVPHVDCTPLTAIIKTLPTLRLQLLGAFRSLRAPQVADLVVAGNVSIEISMLEGVGGIEQLLKHVPLENILLGTHSPLFYLDSAIMKLQESPLAQFQREAIKTINAQKLLHK